MVAAEDSEATMGVVDPIAGVVDPIAGVVDPIAGVGDLVAVGSLVVAASEAARDLLAEEVTPTAAGPELAAISVRREIVSRMFLPPSTIASGIRSATPAVPRVRVRVLPRVPVRGVPRVPVRDAIPEARRTQASPLITPEFPMARGTPLAHQEALRNEEAALPVSSAEPPARRRASSGAVPVGGAVGKVGAVGVGAVATVGGVDGVGAGAAGASASDGRTGDLAGGSAGILGCTTPTGMLRWLTPTRITATMGPTIRRTVRVRRQIRHITMTSRQAT